MKITECSNEACCPASVENNVKPQGKFSATPVEDALFTSRFEHHSSALHIFNSHMKPSLKCTLQMYHYVLPPFPQDDMLSCQ